MRLRIRRAYKNIYYYGGQAVGAASKKRVLQPERAKRVSEKKSCESRALSGVLLHKFSKIRKQMKAVVRPGRSFRMTLYRKDGQ